MSSIENSIEFAFKCRSDVLSGHGVADTRSLRLRSADVPYGTIREARARGPFLALLVDTSKLPSQLVPEVREHVLVLEVGPSRAEELRLFINQQISRVRANAHQNNLTQHGQEDQFRSERCPACNATINLTGLPDSPYLFCPACEALAVKNPSTGRRIPVSTPENARQGQCEVCGYYGRVKEYKETNMDYYVVVRVYKTTFRQTCDSCASEYARQNKYDAFRGLGTMLKTKRGQGETWKRLAHANSLAAQKQLTEAIEIYNELLQEWPSHPGVLFDLAMAHMAVRKRAEAEAFARRALKACSNYGPALALLKELDEIIKQPSGPPRPPQIRPQPPTTTLPRPSRAPEN